MKNNHLFLCVIVIATLFLTTNVDKKPMLPIIVKAVDSLFHNPTDVFWTGRVLDVLFDGIPVDCSGEEFQAKAVCSVFQSGEVKAARVFNDTHYMFSLFGGVSFVLVLVAFR